MGREVRRVPPTWQHPTEHTRYGLRYRPLHEGPAGPKIEKWDRAAALFSEGKGDDGKPLPESAAGCTFEEWSGSRPDPSDYMPTWSEVERTHYQMYENTSEGTPISPVFGTPEQLAHWLADTNASAFGDMTLSYERWLEIARGRPTIGMVMTIGGDRPPAFEVA